MEEKDAKCPPVPQTSVLALPSSPSTKHQAPSTKHQAQRRRRYKTMPWTTFEEIEAWQVARILNQRVWEILQAGTFGKDFALMDQLNRSVGSTMDNTLPREVKA